MYELKKIYLIPEKKGYRVAYTGSKIIIEIPSCYMPFGIEKYNNKEILNIYIDTKKSNEIYNSYVDIKSFENAFDTIRTKNEEIKLPDGFLKEIESSTFYHNIISEKIGEKMRLHVKKNLEIFKMENGKKILLTSADIKGKNAKLRIELNSIWIHGGNYGLVWYVNQIEM
jgi:hypothetical protein